METETIYLEAWLKAYAEILIVHLVGIHVRVKQTEMARDGEEKVIIVWRELGEFVLEHLWHLRCPCAFFGNPCLSLFRKKFIRNVAKPGLKHGADDIDVI